MSIFAEIKHKPEAKQAPKADYELNRNINYEEDFIAGDRIPDDHDGKRTV